MAAIAQNLSMSLHDGPNGKGTICRIEFDVTQSFGLSSTGKSETVASSRGNVSVPGTDVKFGLNAFKPAAAVAIVTTSPAAVDAATKPGAAPTVQRRAAGTK